MRADELSPVQYAVALAAQKHALALGCSCRPDLRLRGDGSEAWPFEADVHHKPGCAIAEGIDGQS